MKIVSKLFLAAVAVSAVVSCNAYKRLGYLQDMEADVSYSMPQQPDPIISKGDRLNITVNCTNPELAEPFNVSNGFYNPGGQTGGVRVVTDNSNSSVSGFEVNRDGNIIYPILGSLHVEGMTLKQLSEYIENEIAARKLIKEPMVRVSFDNFKIIVLGEAGKGVYSIPEGKIDIFGALALADDLTDDAVHDDVWVVRTREGVRQLYRIDLTTKDCYYSPAFFLQQNDMVYAKPHQTKALKSEQTRWSMAATLLSAVGMCLNIFVVFRYYSR